MDVEMVRGRDRADFRYETREEPVLYRKSGSCLDHHQFSHTKNAQCYFLLNVFKSNGRFSVDLRRGGARVIKQYYQLISVF